MHKPKALPDTAKDVYEKEDFSGVGFNHVAEPKNMPKGDGAPKDLPSVKGKGSPAGPKEPLKIGKFTDKKEAVIEGSLTKSFFKEFEDFLKEKKLDVGLVEEVLDRDLLSKMKQFYLHEKDGKQMYFHPEEINSTLTLKLQSLKQMEKEWYTGQKQLQEVEKHLYNKEAEIEFSLGELKRLLSQIKSNVELKADIAPSQYFNAVDGKVLRNFQELKMALKTLSQPAFEHHVNKQRNDFANWIRGVFKNDDLAEAMESTRTREELVKLLDEL